MPPEFGVTSGELISFLVSTIRLPIGSPFSPKTLRAVLSIIIIALGVWTATSQEPAIIFGVNTWRKQESISIVDISVNGYSFPSFISILYGRGSALAMCVKMSTSFNGISCNCSKTVAGVPEKNSPFELFKTISAM